MRPVCAKNVLSHEKQNRPTNFVSESQAHEGVCAVTTTKYNKTEIYIELLIDTFISERARLVHIWPLRAPTWTLPPSNT